MDTSADCLPPRLSQQLEGTLGQWIFNEAIVSIPSMNFVPVLAYDPFRLALLIGMINAPANANTLVFVGTNPVPGPGNTLDLFQSWLSQGLVFPMHGDAVRQAYNAFNKNAGTANLSVITVRAQQ